MYSNIFCPYTIQTTTNCKEHLLAKTKQWVSDLSARVEKSLPHPRHNVTGCHFRVAELFDSRIRVIFFSKERQMTNFQLLKETSVETKQEAWRRRPNHTWTRIIKWVFIIEWVPTLLPFQNTTPDWNLIHFENSSSLLAFISSLASSAAVNHPILYLLINIVNMWQSETFVWSPRFRSIAKLSQKQS